MYTDDEDDFLAPAAPWAITSQSRTEFEDCSKSDIFSHRNEFESIAKDSLEYEKQRAAKAKAKQDKAEQLDKEKAAERSPSRKRDSGGGDEKDGLKKRRINAEESKKLLAGVGILATSVIDLEDSEDESGRASVVPVRRSPRTSPTKNLKNPSGSRSSLSSSMEPEITYGAAVQTKEIAKPTVWPQSPLEEEEEEDSDPEIAAIARNARENARRKRELAKKALLQDGAKTGSSMQLPTPPPADATIQILITSPLPNTTQLICSRKLSQDLSALRKAWCGRQNSDEATIDRIFFTYLGHRLYDSTTVRRLGIAMDELGNVYREDDPTKENVDKVHVEAVTEEIYQEMKAERARQSRIASGQCEEPQDAPPESIDTQPEAGKQYTKMLVRAKGKPDFRLRVAETTKFLKIIKAAKKEFGFSDEQSVYLEFDAERLNPDEKVGNSDIEDMDIIEMHLD